MDEYKSSFITYELEPGPQDISEALLKILQPEFDGYFNAVVIEYDDIAMKTKLIVRTGFIDIRFDEQSFFSSVLCFTAGWYYKHYNEYGSERIVNLSTTKNTLGM